MPLIPSRAQLELGAEFFDQVQPARFPKLRLRFRNQRWAERIGLGSLDAVEWEAAFARFEPIDGSFEAPLALRYHGHQFQTYNPQIGDGRGFLFAQLVDPPTGRILDLGTKGSGRTPWSRSGDGRLTLKGAVREALATEMLEALGVYTSKTFSIFETGDLLERGDEPSPARGAVLVRLNHGHIRFGSFQRQSYLGNAKGVAALLRFATEHFVPEAAIVNKQNLTIAFLEAVAKRSARLCASWMSAGFVHGVLNTDNMNVTGESFDYGPYRFLPHFDPAFTAAYFDHSGLYAYGRQPDAVMWNIDRLAEALGLAEGCVAESFANSFNTALSEKFLLRLGIEQLSATQTNALLEAVFAFLSESRIGFDRFFYDVYGGRFRVGEHAALYDSEAGRKALSTLGAHRPTEPSVRALGDPYFVQPEPCSLLIDEIEAIWGAIAERDDWSRFEDKIAEIRRMGKAYGRDASTLDTSP